MLLLGAETKERGDRDQVEARVHEKEDPDLGDDRTKNV